MRENKFKFLLENGEVTQPYYLKELIDSDAYINIECEYSSKIKQELQYTGLKDKNDMEIYKGDIVKVCNGSINGIGMKDKPYEIKWKPNKGWDMHLFLWDNQGENNMDSTHWIEVIGNIYENKELLNEI